MNIIDLDALVPPSTTIKFQGQDIEVPPPSTFDFLKLSTLATDINKVDAHDDAKLQEAINSITVQIHKMIPRIAGTPLSLQQIDTLVAMFTRMSMTPEQTELKEKGITPATAKKDPTD
jgi:hypothetical protein